MNIEPNILLYIFIGLLTILLLIVAWVWLLERRVKRLLVGKNSASIEDSLTSISKDIKDLKQFTKDMEEYLTTVEKRLQHSIQHVQTTRYNPFKGTGSGGNNSFSTAFLNERGDGVVLTSLYARDRISVFAKPVKNYVSEHELSEEELESINKCKPNPKT